MPGFAHLTAWSCHTHHQSVLTPQSLVATAAQAGQTAVGLCDRATLAGIPAFNTACHEHGVKPVIGEAFWLVDGSVDRSDPVMVKTEHRTDDMGKDMAGFFPRPGWLVNLIATNSHGWASLVQLHNHSWMCAKDGVPLVDVAMLAAHRDGLICLTGGMTGPLSHPLLFGRDQVAAQNLEALVGVYGANRVFVEVQNHGVAEERTVLGRLFNVAREQHVSLVVTNDNRYATPVERAVLDVVRAARVRKKHTDVAVFRQPGDGWHVRTETELRGVFPNSPVWQDAMDRAVWITDRISDTVLPAPESHTPNVGGAEWIRTQLIERLTTVYQGKPWVRQAVRQARAELDVMIKTGFTDYVAITAQLVEWAKTQGIRVGPGRGSSVASVICHVLGVTEVDPLEHGLLFERFLDPSDPDPSDIDLDVQQTRIPEVVGRLRDMLGTDHVARLSRPDTATGKPFDLDLINTIGDDDPELTCLVRDVWEGQTTGVDSHASGYVLSDEPLDQTVSMRVDGKSGEWLTEWDGPTMEAMGYPKLDVLSSVELEVDEQVSRATGGHTTMDAGYAQLATGRLAGVFQLGAESASRIAREIQPRSVGEVAACVALIRPGPRQAFQDTAYIDRCHDPELNVCPWTTDETEIRLLEPVVGSTRWMIIFQEQVMRLAGVMAGFDASERAGLRHALSGKDQARVDWFGGEFKRRAQQVQTGQDGTILSPAFHTTTVESVWQSMAHAGAYMFPQAHAAAYAMTVVRMAGLKHDHPAEFAAARLSVTDAGDRDGREKRIRVIRELRHDGTMITPPDVNRSRADTTGHDGRVILGLGEVRGVGGQAEAILLERDMNGPFNGLHDAVTRCPRVSRGAWQGLVEAGAFDQFGTRLGHTMVLGTAVPPPALEWMVEERWARQNMVLRCAVDPTPIQTRREEVTTALNDQAVCGVRDALKLCDNAQVSLIGVLAQWEVLETRDGKDYARFTVDGTTAVIDGVAWNETLTRIEQHGVPAVGSIIRVDGRIRCRQWDGGQTRTVTAARVTRLELPETTAPPAEAPLIRWTVMTPDQTIEPDCETAFEPVTESVTITTDTPVGTTSIDTHVRVEVDLPPQPAATIHIRRLSGVAGGMAIHGAPAQLVAWLHSNPDVLLKTQDGQVWTFSDRDVDDTIDWRPLPPGTLRGIRLPPGLAYNR